MPLSPLWNVLPFFQPAGLPIQVMWQLGRDTSHGSAGLEYPRGGGMVLDCDPEVGVT